MQAILRFMTSYGAAVICAISGLVLVCITTAVGVVALTYGEDLSADCVGIVAFVVAAFLLYMTDRNVRAEILDIRRQA
ncbi:hypothetical protein [Cupriavidus sp. DF5525]|uniref:hypothetical protein n=1 Tax=Cupriavidus sp. DF5525 TaxID=3160989 RepID=UPI0032DF1C8E